MSLEPRPPAGIYLHLPFCHSKCTYCGFVTGSFQADLALAYVAALEREIRAFPPPEVVASGRVAVDTVYFGGGTPSIMAADDVGRLLAACRDVFSVSADAEITLEMNPGDADPEKLEALRELGINRVSLGVQSFLDHQLRATGRDHDAAAARTAFRRLRAAGFDNVSVDLIAGLPNQTLDEWKYNLTEAVALDPEHLSLYLLEVKEGTKLAAMVAAGTLPVPDDDLAAEMYEYLVDRLDAAGYEAYEISNFARGPAFRSRHNLKYWTEAPFFGFGVGAHSYDGAERYSTEPTIHRYIDRIQTEGSAVADRTSRTPRERWHEALMMGLRVREGVSLDRLERSFGIDPRQGFDAEIERLTAAGLIELDGDILRLTRAGRLLSNEVFVAFL